MRGMRTLRGAHVRGRGTRPGARTLLVLALMLAMPAGARAQDPTRADSADVLMGTAERLHAQGSEALAGAIARLVRSQYGDTPAATRANALLASLRAQERRSSGRIGLIAFSTIYGAWLGAAVPVTFDADEPEIYGLGLLTGAPVGFFAGRAFARTTNVTGGDAGVITWGGSWGTWQGAGWMMVVGDRTVCDGDLCFVDEADASEIVGAMVAGGLLGIGAGALAAHRRDIEGGTATMVGWGSLWGTWAGVVLAVLADLDGEDEALIAALLGGDVGLASMAVLAPRWYMSNGRAWLINASGIMGGAIGGGILLLAQPSNEKAAILFPAFGSAVGLIVGAYRTRHMDDELREGMLYDPTPGALVRLRDGEWRVALPQPEPTLLRGGAANSRDVELGLRVPLLDARF